MPEHEVSRANKDRFGRTWPDLISSWAFWLIVGIIILVFWYLDANEFVFQLPIWVIVAVGMSFVFTPFLYARALEDSKLVLVADGAQQLTEYRIGSKYGVYIEGAAVQFNSTSGAHRMLLTSFDPSTGQGKGTAFEGHTVFDMARDLGILRSLSDAYAKHLREERLVKQMVGIRVEEQVGLYSDQWLRMLYGSLSVDEIEDILGRSVESDGVNIETNDDAGGEPESIAGEEFSDG